MTAVNKVSHFQNEQYLMRRKQKKSSQVFDAPFGEQFTTEGEREKNLTFAAFRRRSRRKTRNVTTNISDLFLLLG